MRFAFSCSGDELFGGGSLLLTTLRIDGGMECLFVFIFQSKGEGEERDLVIDLALNFSLKHTLGVLS